MAGPNDSGGNELMLGDYVQLTPVVDPFDPNDVIGVVDDIQTFSASAVGKVHILYQACDEVGQPGIPRGTGTNRWGEWQDGSEVTIIIRCDGSAPNGG